MSFVLSRRKIGSNSKNAAASIKRRKFFTEMGTYATTAYFGSAFVVQSGCTPADQSASSGSSEESKPAESSVPLRLLVIGDPRTAEAMERGWRSVSSTPLRIRVIEFQRGQTPDNAAILGAAKSADLLISPAILMPDLLAAERIETLPGQTLEDLAGAVLPALDLSVVRYADELYGLPIGAKKPALLSADPVETPHSWADYDELVKTKFKNKAAEPIAAGWAGWMFVQRLARQSNRWLFDRETFASGIAHSDNIAALAQMKETVQRYPESDLTPGEIYQRVSAGGLLGGVGFPPLGSSSEADLLQVTSLPVSESVVRGLVDPFSPVILWSSQCRQSAVSKTFCRWVGSEEGTQQLGQGLPGFSPTRGGAALPASGVYDRWLVEQYETPLTLPTLRLLRGAEYYSVLDQAVIRCVRGNQDPGKTLQGVSDEWDRITHEVSAEKQLRSWRRNQGLRA